MRYQLLKLLFLGVLFIGHSALAIETPSVKRLDPQAKEKAQSAFDMATTYAKQGNYEKALEYLKSSYEYEPADGTAFNFGLVYEGLKDYDNAIKWYKKAFEMGRADGGGVNLGLLYDEKLKDYDNAIKWYKKAANNGISIGAYNLAILYKEHKDIKNAIKWYKKGVELKDYTSMKNLGNLYHEQNENIKGAAYMLGLLSIKPEKKEKLLSYLKTKWKLTDEELKKAYELQKTLVPNPYTGGID